MIDGDGARTSYGALARAVDASAAAALRGARRAGRADTVAFLVEPGALYVETLLAIWRAGGIAVPLSPLHAAPELAHVVQDAAPRALVASAALAPRLGRRGRRASARAAPRRRRWSRRRSRPARCAAATPDADALMLYTSGTTGRPKGVRLSHAALAATVTSLRAGVALAARRSPAARAAAASHARR